MMSDQPSANIPQPTVLVEIVLVPFEDEDDDFETLSAVEDVKAAVLSYTTALQDYTTQVASNQQRGTGVIVLLGEIVHHVVAQKDLIIAFLQAGTAAIGALAKQRRVGKIEVNLDGDSFSIENPDTVTAQRLLDLFEAKHPGITAKVTPSSSLQVTGKVSKKAHRTSK
jgi:hypothetical protein